MYPGIAIAPERAASRQTSAMNVKTLARTLLALCVSMILAFSALRYSGLGSTIASARAARKQSLASAWRLVNASLNHRSSASNSTPVKETATPVTARDRCGRQRLDARLSCALEIVSEAHACVRRLNQPSLFSARRSHASDIFGSSWPADKPRAIIHVLIQDPHNGTAESMARAADRLGVLERMLRLLDQNFNDHYRYPVVVFVSPGFAEKSKRLVSAMTRSNVRFVELDFKGPAMPYNQTIHPVVEKKCPKTWLGYRHMCRYHAGVIYKEPGPSSPATLLTQAWA